LNSGFGLNEAAGPVAENVETWVTNSGHQTEKDLSKNDFFTNPRPVFNMTLPLEVNLAHSRNVHPQG
jgi:hypothetical protein